MSYGCGTPVVTPFSPLGFLGGNWWIWIALFFFLFCRGGIGGIGGIGRGFGFLGNYWWIVIVVLIICLPGFFKR